MISPIEDRRLKARVDARKEAKEIIDLACSEAQPMAHDNRNVFWGMIRDQALEMAPLPEQKPQVVKARPMTNLEARKFEKQTCPFGQYATQRIAGVPLDYLRWLSDQTFVDDLRRYLANETIARQ